MLVTQLAHHGMIFVPAGYAAGGAMFGVEEAKGGSPWGAGTLAGPDGSRQPSEVELEAIRVQVRLERLVSHDLGCRLSFKIIMAVIRSSGRASKRCTPCVLPGDGLVTPEAFSFLTCYPMTSVAGEAIR